MRHVSLRGLQQWSAVVAASVCLSAVPASAQRVAGPYQGLFGAGPANKENGQSLELRGSLFGAWDEAAVKGIEPVATSADPAGPADRTGSDRGLLSGTGPGAQGGLTYLKRTRALSFNLGGSSEVRVYPESDDFTVRSHDANTGLDWRLGSRVLARATGSGNYSSFYQFAPFLGAATGGAGPLVPGFGFSAATERNTRVAAGAGTVITLTRRSTLTAEADWSEWRFLDRTDADVETRGGRGTLAYQLTRALGLRAGYGYQEGRYNFKGSEPVPIQTIDAGVDYRDTLEFARRTALSFGTSTSAIKFEDETHYRVEGSAVLSRGFRRTWSAALAYARGTNFTAGFREPILSDSVSADIGGLVSSRVKWATGAGYSRGNIGFGDGSTFTTYSGGSRLDFALNQRFGLYGQYAYYHYRVPPGSGAAGSVPRFARQTVTAGLTVWVPIIR